MDVLRLIEVRIGKWMAYTDFCMNSEMSLPHCRTFWTWVTVAAVIAGSALASYIAMSIIRGRGRTAEGGDTNGR